jgi:sugar phosphate isomerase/epimerase
MNIGVRAHDLGKLTLNELATKVAEKGFSCIQLPLTKALSDITVGPGQLNPGLAVHIRETLAARNIFISVLGCYFNLIHPDKEERKKKLAWFKEHLRYARDFGTDLVGTETGSLNADISFHPDNAGEKAFETAVACVSELVDEAEKFGVFVGIEGVTKHSINSPEKLARLIERVGSNNLQIIFDPVNLISEENYTSSDQMLAEVFSLFGGRIACLHAKDFVIENNKMKTVPAGEGLLNYKLLLDLYKKAKPWGCILLENAVPDKMAETREFIQKYL